MMRAARTIMLIGLALGFAAGLRAQNLLGMQAALAKQYCGRPLLMQNFRSGSTLHFSSNGAFIKGGHPGPWTLDAYFQVKDVQLKRKSLRLKGRRVLYVYIKRTHRLQPFLGKGLTVEIRTNPTSVNLASLRQALGKIFAQPGEKLADFAPSYWKDYLLHPNFFHSDWSRSKMLREVSALMPGHPVPVRLHGKNVSGIIPPQPTSKPGPSYPELAWRTLHQGTTTLGVEIGSGGRVEREMIIVPSGLGFDEEAAQAVKKWRYKPALRAGKPIPVVALVTIRFRLSG